MNKQASLLAAADRTEEVSGLKRDLGQAEGELGLVKRSRRTKVNDTPSVCYIKEKSLMLIEAS